jgi:hypothetical protein
MIESNPETLKQEMGDLSTEAPKEEKSVSAEKKTPRKKTPAKKTASKSNGAKKEAKTDGISLKDLAKEYKMKESAARRKLRAAGLKPDGRWVFEKGSSQLTKAKAALAATAE